MAEQLANVSDEQIQEVFSAIADFTTVRELKGISDREIESIYAMGVDYYRAGNYADAEKIFRFLTVFEHTSSKYWTAMGSVQQVQGRYDAAIKAYQMASFFDLHNPKPMYYAAECFVKTGDLDNARKALASLEQYGPTDTETGRRFRAKGAELKARIAAK